MEIRTIGNNMPLTGIRPAVDHVPTLPSAQNAEQVRVEAVTPPSAGEAATAGKKAASTDFVSFPLSGKEGADTPGQAGLPAELKQAKEAMARITTSLESLSRASGLQFAIDDELGRVVVKVLDPETQEVIKQFPSEDAIRLAKSLSQLSGNLLQTKA